MRDANLIGAEVKSAGDATVVAGRDVNLGTVTTSRTDDIRWSSDNTRKDETSKETGTTISGAGNVSVGAGRNLTGVAATLSAGETLTLSAGDQLTLAAGENQASAATTDSQKGGMTHSNTCYRRRYCWISNSGWRFFYSRAACKMNSFDKLVISPTWKGSITRIAIMILISLGMWRLPEIIEWLYRFASLGVPTFSRERHWSMFLIVLGVATLCILFDSVRLMLIFFIVSGRADEQSK